MQDVWGTVSANIKVRVSKLGGELLALGGEPAPNNRLQRADHCGSGPGYWEKIHYV